MNVDEMKVREKELNIEMGLLQRDVGSLMDSIRLWGSTPRQDDLNQRDAKILRITAIEKELAELDLAQMDKPDPAALLLMEEEGFQRYEPYALLTAELQVLDVKARELRQALQTSTQEAADLAATTESSEEADAIDNGGRARRLKDRQIALQSSIVEIERRLSANARASEKRLTERLAVRDRFAQEQFASLSAELENIVLGVVPDLASIAERMSTGMKLVRQSRAMGLQLPLASFVIPDLSYACGIRNFASAFGVVPGITVLETLFSRWLKGLSEAGYRVPPFRNDDCSCAVEASGQSLEASWTATAGGAISGARAQARADSGKLAAARQVTGVARRLLAQIGVDI